MRLPEFRNLDLLDFSQPENAMAMQQALQRVRGNFGKEYRLVIGGQHVESQSRFNSLNPSRKSEIVGVCHQGKAEMVEPAIEAAAAAFATWSRTGVDERVNALLKISAIMQERRLELAAWMVFEVGKSWVEADADVAEAIDFCEYYARQMLGLASPPPLVSLPSEQNELRYIALGVGLIIPPWNFPLAILAGMTFASIVAGNTVIVKPSSDSPIIAGQLFKIFEEAGLPPGVVNFLPGSGAEIGDRLVLHPKVRFIAFTGSKEVGLRINQLAASPEPGQVWIKRVVAEMGGKDSIVVDETADLDDAAVGTIVSAFGYQGQKCSACSRVIVTDPVYDRFLEELTSAAGTIIVEGSVEERSVNFGPVVSARAQESILSYIEVGKGEGRLIMGGTAGDPDGFFVRPTIIADVAPEARISQEEIFGPVLAVIRARDFEDALRIANNTEYGLTGSLYSKDEHRIEQAKQEFHAGNLYFNRKCTGALVGVHPFGGFNMSGTDSKAGGPDYLLLFTQAKAISRKV